MHDFLARAVQPYFPEVVTHYPPGNFANFLRIRFCSVCRIKVSSLSTLK